MFKLTLSITFNWKKSINSFGDMVSYTPQFKHKINQFWGAHQNLIVAF